METKDKLIIRKAIFSKFNILSWNFEYLGHLYVNGYDTGSYVGKVQYSNPNCEFDKAIKICDWVFVLVKMTSEMRQILAPQEDPNTWILGGFYDKSHYSFMETIISPEQTLVYLLTYVIENFLPILQPEIFDTFNGDDYVQCDIIPLNLDYIE